MEFMGFNCAAIFPGQGSQYVGMSKEIRENFPWIRKIYEEASDAIRVDILKLCEQGPDSTLQLTANAQPSILVTSYCWSQIAFRELGFTPRAAAGHSLGEYSALLSANAFTLFDAVRLVRRRGELMQTAVPEGKGKMAAVLGLSDEAVKKLCEMATAGDSLVVPANFNAPSQVVIAGHSEAVDRAAELAAGKIPELKARKIIPLKVSAPFHCPLMKEVAELFEKDLTNVHWAALAFPVVFNVDAKLRSFADLVPLLKMQIDHPVLWSACVQTLTENGHTQLVEFGPGKVLTGLVKRIAPENKTYSVESLDDLKTFAKIVKEGEKS
jgi:[acyl-carrier-protein] S-malonyltransferase